MALKLITPPAMEPLSLEEAKHHLRISGDDDDAIVSSLINQAREYCESYQKQKYITQTLELVLDSFPTTNYIEFTDFSPVQNVVSVKYYGTDGTEYIFDAENYIVDTDSLVNRIALGYNKQWPSIALQPINAVRIRVVAGYGDASEVPESVKWAMVLQMRLVYDDYKPEDCQKLESARDAFLNMNRVVPV
ncbi:head-tail connector protein [Desulfosporosinus sp. PR]|uniref:head-tail connector protein n=1 Tax=Candidatus Desulfosporosinus nitrosoreducens TaxID=3401928 RepID=UPI0027EEAF29|nr:head-tail connector protein [Desulfosporosinus sp. PR]MDQ7096932.1 head-tail connector protein [Desulfosporosinus sp. PR]